MVRDVVADLGVGLLRLQRGRLHMLDIFREDAADAAEAADAAGSTGEVRA